MIDCEYIGDWRTSYYTVGAERWDIELSLREDGTYSWLLKPSGPQHKEQSHSGTWDYDPAEGVLSFSPRTTSSPDIVLHDRWVLHELKGLEHLGKSNTYMILRALVLGARNLPKVFYRVHLDPSPDERRR